MGKSNRYDEWGGRENYLMAIADDYGLPFEEVQMIADILGPNEDFDGLITTLVDMTEGGMMYDEYDM